MTDPDVLEEVGRWLRYAREDLKAAELLSEKAACNGRPASTRRPPRRRPSKGL